MSKEVDSMEQSVLKSETQKRSKEESNKSLELEFRSAELESEKSVREEEFGNLKESEEDSLVEQMMVNRALEIEKQVAEKEAEDWKRKFEKLAEAVRKLDELGALEDVKADLDENLKLGLELARIKFPMEKKIETFEVYEGGRSKQVSGTPYITTPIQDNIVGRRSRDNLSSRGRVNKRLVFVGDGYKSTDVVDLSDSETEECKEKESGARDTIQEGSIGENYEDEEACEVDTGTPTFGRNRNRVITSMREEIYGVENYEDEDVEVCKVDTNTPLSCRKRKHVITSDSEKDDEDEDNIPIICTLKKLKPPNQEMPDLVDTPTKEENGFGRLRTQRRVSSRLNKQRVSKEISASRERLVGIQTTGNAEDDETEEESESESQSLDGFIVDDDDDDDDDSHDETVSENSSETREEESDGEIDYAQVISGLRRDKNPKKRKWEYEADMLADFGKDPELCMRAVCVLYRFQTEDEKVTSSSHVCNGRGFSKFDAIRGTRLGKFLTNGDPEGDLKRSVEELESFEYDGVESCRALADRYSKQLFQIYNNREDPFFSLPLSPRRGE